VSFDGPDNYSATTGDHDQDKTGDARVNKKFDPKRPGTYRARVQVISPVPVESEPVSVQTSC
jgi:hypothetical protein